MIDSNPNDFAGALPLDDASANWSWLKERVEASGVDSLHNWLASQLIELETDYADWMTSKSRQASLQSELRDSRVA